MQILATVATYSLAVFVLVGSAMALRAPAGNVETRLRWLAIGDQSGQTVGGAIAFLLTYMGVFHQTQCV